MGGAGTWESGRRGRGDGVELKQSGEDVFGARVEGVAGREEALGEGGGGAVGARGVAGRDALCHNSCDECPQPLSRRLAYEHTKDLRRRWTLSLRVG